ncbi:hypothetical protein DY000_02050323 [Brassica cretica]|uniref:Uncharacterized protein n=1 Tax=Brassica cretica TaxID=69181 RepID=A0ABQ7EPV9_BRACR|nr:hypothetical protein DY000_02050323 [Brassica cretica]
MARSESSLHSHQVSTDTKSPVSVVYLRVKKNAHVRDYDLMMIRNFSEDVHQGVGQIYRLIAKDYDSEEDGNYFKLMETSEKSDDLEGTRFRHVFMTIGVTTRIMSL